MPRQRIEIGQSLRDGRVMHTARNTAEVILHGPRSWRGRCPGVPEHQVKECRLARVLVDGPRPSQAASTALETLLMQTTDELIRKISFAQRTYPGRPWERLKLQDAVWNLDFLRSLR